MQQSTAAHAVPAPDKTFIFDRYAFDRASNTLRLHYAFEDGPAFEETIVFPPPGRDLLAESHAAFDSTARVLFLLAGVSYYKAYAPTHLKCNAFPLDRATADFIETVYRNGLGEFSYVNKLDLRGRLKFAVDDAAAPPAPVRLAPGGGLLVPVGGGKDSIVALECLRGAGEAVTLFALSAPGGIAAPIKATIETAALPALTATRAISPALITLNKEGALNGHVPITAILSVIAFATAIRSGLSAVVMANEHSASTPNVVYNGQEINHQYSKSLAFEEGFAAYAATHITPDVGYFSLLRPLGEIAIARRFAALTKYHDVFRSCNTAFRQDAQKRGQNWCCDCPKCRFVFLALAPFMEKQKLTGIFGKDMLDDPAQTQGFAELCGLVAHKPFECVGEIEESALAMEKLFAMAPWQTDHIVRELGAQLQARPKDFGVLYDSLFALRPGHRVPDRFLRMLHESD